MAGTNETCIGNMIIESDLLCVGGAGEDFMIAVPVL